MIRHRVLRWLIWVCNVCLISFNEIRGNKGLTALVGSYCWPSQALLLSEFFFVSLGLLILKISYSAWSYVFLTSTSLVSPCSFSSWEWSGRAMVLGTFQRPIYMDNRRVRAYFACSRCGWGSMAFFSRLLYFSIWARLDMGWNTVSRAVKPNTSQSTNHWSFLKSKISYSFRSSVFLTFSLLCFSLLLRLLHFFYCYYYWWIGWVGHSEFGFS